MPKFATLPNAGSIGCLSKRMPRRPCTALIPSEQERQHSFLGVRECGQGQPFPLHRRPNPSDLGRHLSGHAAVLPDAVLVAFPIVGLYAVCVGRSGTAKGQAVEL